MFSGKKRYSKIVSLLLVCCMIAGIIGVKPMVAEAAVTTDMFRKEAGATKNDANITMTNQSDGSVLVQHDANADTNLNNHTVSTTNSYMYQLADGVHLEISDIKGRTGYEDQYSFVLFMGLSWNHYYFQNLNYADSGIAMAFSHDGSYKIWTTASANNPDPSKDADYILGYGKISTENAPCNNEDSLVLDIQRESAGNYYVVINGEKVKFQSSYSEADVHLAFQVWAPLHNENYQFCYDNDTSKGTFMSGYGAHGSSYVITDIQKVDLDATEGKGFLADYNNYITYKTEEPLSAFPLTFETEVYWTGTEDSSRNTTIAGTWDFGGKRSYDVRMLSSGQLLLTVRKSTSQFQDIILYGAMVAKNEWTHVAIVVNPEADATTGQYYINTYINGVLKSTVGFGFNQKLNDSQTAWIAGTPVDPTTLKPALPLVIGTNNVAADPMLAEGETPATTTLYATHRGTCFDGRIKSVSLWNKARTADEISADYTNGVTVSDETLLGHYELEEGKTRFVDQSGKGNDVVARKSWIQDLSEIGKTELVKGTDYEYSMIVVGDTQIINDYKNGSIDTTNYDNSKLATLYKWIAANKEALNIQFVMGLGDITDYNHETEWANADYSHINYLLNNDIRFASAIGNHDYSAGYNSMSYLTTEKYQSYIEGNYWKDVKKTDGYMEDSYQLLEVETSEGTLKYLLMTLGYGVDDNVLQWAGEVCEQYPDYNVIVATHAYLQCDGTTLDSENDVNSTIPSLDGPVSYYPYETSRNDGDDIWNEFVSKHENITMVLSGHVCPDRVVCTSQIGDNGNKVTELLINPQGIDASGDNGELLSTGMVSILYFDADGNAVAHRNYSTIQEKYFDELSQFEDLGINVIKPLELAGVELSKSNLLMIPGQSETLTASLVPTGVSGEITWSSKDSGVASIDATTGVVTANTTGETVITATAGNFSAECKVWVTEKPSEILHADAVAGTVGTGISFTDDIYGIRMTYASGIYDWERAYITNRYIKDGYNLNIDDIQTESADYTLAIMIHNKSDASWYNADGYMLLLRKTGEVAIVKTNVNGLLDNTAIDSAFVGKLKDSVYLRFKMEDTTCIVEVNGTKLEIPNATIVLGTEGYVRLSIGAAQNFTLSGTTLTYDGTLLTAPLNYRINRIGYDTSMMEIMDSYTSIFDYYRASGEAPVKGGYVFAGWYEDAGAATPIEPSVKEAEVGKTYYAKFLPEDVLSVKAQLKLGEGVSTTDASGTTEMRIITTVDSDAKKFAEAGFVVTSGTTSKVYSRYKAYSSLAAAGVTMTPSVFNTCSKQFVTVNIGSVKWNETTKPVDRPITVQAYWKTNDGTIVYGAARTLTIQQGLEAINASAQPYGLR